MPSKLTNQPLLVVLSGPSGAGKDAVIAKLKDSDFPVERIVTVTTRPRRAIESDSVDYHFVSPEEFQKMIRGKKLLEWASVYGNWYGVPKEAVKRALERRQDVMLRTDVQGAATIKKTMPQAILIFLMPASMEELDTRLKQRHTESSLDLAVRTRIAEEEIKRLPLFDYVVFNRQGKIDSAVADIKAILRAEKCRVRA
ncbi:MAG: guanylate kinase [Dehalococcoidia bacterium]|nr:MAG: guanylate kinase [Dehalococcoidia bacterium]